MKILIILQKGTPDIINLILFLIGILLCLLAINTLYEWIKNKFFNNKPPENSLISNDSKTVNDKIIQEDHQIDSQSKSPFESSEIQFS